MHDSTCAYRLPVTGRVGDRDPAGHAHDAMVSDVPALPGHLQMDTAASPGTHWALEAVAEPP